MPAVAEIAPGTSFDALLAGPDAALVDVGLPDRDGIELAYELAALPWRPRVVLTSSDGEVAAGIDARAAGRHLTFIAKEHLPNVALRQLLASA